MIDLTIPELIDAHVQFRIKKFQGEGKIIAINSNETESIYVACDSIVPSSLREPLGVIKYTFVNRSRVHNYASSTFNINDLPKYANYLIEIRREHILHYDTDLTLFIQQMYNEIHNEEQ